jgi:hypothetical protein
MGEAGQRKTLFMGVGALIVLWGAIGAFDVGNLTFSGYQTDGNNTIVQITSGSPAEAAGLQVGDYIRSIGGVSMEDTKALISRGRPEVGEERVFVVERSGETVEANLQYAALPGNQKGVTYGATLIGLCYLFFGLWAFSSAPTRSTKLLALLGLLFAPAFVTGPYISSAALRNLTGGIITTAIIIGFAVLLDFVVSYSSDKPTNKRLIYGPAWLVALITLAFVIIQPASTSGVNVFFRVMFGLFVAGYFGLALISIIRNFLRATPAARSADGLGLMLLGTLIGLLPITISSIVGLLAPTVVLPGSQYYFLTLILIPITFAVAAIKSAQTEAPAAAPAGGGLGV